jgi:hypothetical protein
MLGKTFFLKKEKTRKKVKEGKGRERNGCERKEGKGREGGRYKKNRKKEKRNELPTYNFLMELQSKSLLKMMSPT